MSSHTESVVAAILGCAAVLALSATQLRADTVWDAVNDFSLSSNPNGAWSYGTLSNGTSGTFTAFTSATGNSFVINWGTSTSAVTKNITSGTYDYYTNVLPTNVLMLSPGSPDADVRWTAPVTGDYSCSGVFSRVDTTNYNAVDVGVSESQITMFEVDNFITYGVSEPFNFGDLYLTAGTTLDFWAYTPNGGGYYGTGFAATITEIPEPTTLTLLATALLGLVGAFCLRRRRAKV
jgi:hypothetical protein